MGSPTASPPRDEPTLPAVHASALCRSAHVNTTAKMAGVMDDETEKRLREQFAKRDDDGNGQYDVKELTEVYMATGKTAEQAEQIAKNVMKRSDTNKDGKVTLDEYIAASKSPFL